MMRKRAFVVGLRIDPDTSVADFYSVWYEREDDRDVFLTLDGRVRWSKNVLDARRLAESQLGDEFSVESELNGICDVALALYAVSSGEPRNETAVLETLNFLYDLLNSIRPTVELPNSRVLDVAVRLLTEGEPLYSVVEQVGGEAAVLEPILASLGRVFAFSSFGA